MNKKEKKLKLSSLLLTSFIGYSIFYFVFNLKDHSDTGYILILIIIYLIDAVKFTIFFSLLMYAINKIILEKIIPSNYILAFTFLFSLLLNYFSFSPPNQERELKKAEKRILKLNIKERTIHPDLETLKKDTSFLKLELRKFFTDFDFNLSKNLSSHDSLQYIKINNILGWAYSSPAEITKENYEIQKFQKISKTLDIEFIHYSPNSQYFICLFKYKNRYNQRDEKDVIFPFIVLGEKELKGIRLYHFTSNLGNSIHTDRDFYLRFFSDWSATRPFIEDFGRYSLTRLEPESNISILDSAFWQTQDFFSLVEINNTRIKRFKTKNLYHNGHKMDNYVLRNNIFLEY